MKIYDVSRKFMGYNYYKINKEAMLMRKDSMVKVEPEKNSRIDEVYSCLVKLDAKRWEWFSMIPREDAVSVQEVTRWLDENPGIIKAVEDVFKLEVQENLWYMSHKLFLKKDFRERFLKEITFFQEYYIFAKNEELQAILKKLKTILLSY